MDHSVLHAWISLHKHVCVLSVRAAECSSKADEGKRWRTCLVVLQKHVCAPPELHVKCMAHSSTHSSVGLTYFKSVVWGRQCPLQKIKSSLKSFFIVASIHKESLSIWISYLWICKIDPQKVFHGSNDIINVTLSFFLNSGKREKSDWTDQVRIDQWWTLSGGSKSHSWQQTAAETFSGSTSERGKCLLPHLRTIKFGHLGVCWRYLHGHVPGKHPALCQHTTAVISSCQILSQRPLCGDSRASSTSDVILSSRTSVSPSVSDCYLISQRSTSKALNTFNNTRSKVIWHFIALDILASASTQLWSNHVKMISLSN